MRITAVNLVSVRLEENEKADLCPKLKRCRLFLKSLFLKTVRKGAIALAIEQVRDWNRDNCRVTKECKLIGKKVKTCSHQCLSIRRRSCNRWAIHFKTNKASWNRLYSSIKNLTLRLGTEFTSLNQVKKRMKLVSS